MEQLRICRTCKQEKPLSEFNKDKRHSSGYATQCKECKRAYDRSRYEKVTLKNLNTDKNIGNLIKSK